MFSNPNAAPAHRLAFELNVLRRLKFSSVILPFAGEPRLGAHLKSWNVSVAANDLTQANFVKSVALIQNNRVKLTGADVEMILESASDTAFNLHNESLRRWFDESDAGWFDGVRENIERLTSAEARAIALSIGIKVGDYVSSFTERTRSMRQPLSTIYRQFWESFPAPIDNNRKNICRNMTANDFVGEGLKADLMFLRLPRPHNFSQRGYLGAAAWREEWIRGSNHFWNDFERAQSSKLGAAVETKAQYLQFLEELLHAADRFPQWAIACAEDQFVSAQNIVEAVGRMRRVDTTFTKDFTEVLGEKAVIITARK